MKDSDIEEGCAKNKTIRRTWEEQEVLMLSPLACLSKDSAGRALCEEKCPIRTCFQRDRDRILHSRSFRRLKHKTQALMLPEGDHVRTRLTHTLEVSQIARTIARAMRLNEDLTEAIALGHDLGHTPFGHVGERALDRIAADNGMGSFHHAAQSLRVVDVLEKDGRGLNLTYEVRMGIVQHSKGQGPVEKTFLLENPSTLEAWVVRVSDSIAYLNHDLDDASKSDTFKFFEYEDIPAEVLEVLGRTHGERITTMVTDVISSTQGGKIAFSRPVLHAIETLRRFLYDKVYASAQVKDEEPKIERLINDAYLKSLKENMSFSPTDAIDFIAMMTDRFLIKYSGGIEV